MMMTTTRMMPFVVVAVVGLVWLHLAISSAAFSVVSRCHGSFQSRKYTALPGLYPHTNLPRSQWICCAASSSGSENAATTSTADTTSNSDVVETIDLDDEPISLEYAGRMSTASAVAPNFRCGFVCILGQPNMGKSTLLNALLQEDLCISSSRPQTTRHAILGLLTTNTSQVCLIDTPGVIEQPAYKLQDAMMEAVKSSLYDADVLLVVTDVKSAPLLEEDAIFQKVQNSNKPTIVCINKIDLVDSINKKRQFKAEQERLQQQETNAEDGDDSTTTISNPDVPSLVSIEEAVARWRQLLPNAIAIIPAASSNGPDDSGVVALRRLLTGGPDLPAAWRALGRPIPGMLPAQAEKLYYTDDQAIQLLNFPKSPPLYDPEALTDRTERFIASELIRASLFKLLKKELPYCCQVQVTSFKETSDMIRMTAQVFVERDSQKVIVIGKGGQQIREIGIQAREKLEEFFQTKIYLDLSVKVNKDWRKNEGQLKTFGYLKN